MPRHYIRALGPHSRLTNGGSCSSECLDMVPRHSQESSTSQAVIDGVPRNWALASGHSVQVICKTNMRIRTIVRHAVPGKPTLWIFFRGTYPPCHNSFCCQLACARFTRGFCFFKNRVSWRHVPAGSPTSARKNSQTHPPHVPLEKIHKVGFPGTPSRITLRPAHSTSVHAASGVRHAPALIRADRVPPVRSQRAAAHARHGRQTTQERTTRP